MVATVTNPEIKRELVKTYIKIDIETIKDYSTLICIRGALKLESRKY